MPLHALHAREGCSALRQFVAEHMVAGIVRVTAATTVACPINITATGRSRRPATAASACRWLCPGSATCSRTLSGAGVANKPARLCQTPSTTISLPGSRPTGTPSRRGSRTNQRSACSAWPLSASPTSLPQAREEVFALRRPYGPLCLVEHYSAFWHTCSLVHRR